MSAGPIFSSHIEEIGNAGSIFGGTLEKPLGGKSAGPRFADQELLVILPIRGYSALTGRLAVFAPAQVYGGQTGGNALIQPLQGYSGSTGGRVPAAPGGTFGGLTSGVADNPTFGYTAVTSGVVDYSGLPSPTFLVAIPVAQTHISLTWTDNSLEEDGFRIERSPNGQGIWTTIGSVGADQTIFIDQFAVPLTVYDYRVFAFEGIEVSAPSNIATASTVLSPSPGVPQPPVDAALRRRILEFLSSGVYGLERDPDGNVGGNKF